MLNPPPPRSPSRPAPLAGTGTAAIGDGSPLRGGCCDGLEERVIDKMIWAKCSGQNDLCSKLVCTRRTTTGRSFNFLLNSLYQRVRRAPFAHRSQETNDMHFRSFAFAFTMGFSATTALFAQAGAVNPALYSDMRWREIG